MPRLLGLLLGFSLCLWAQKPIPVILDTDIGDDIDDALALAVALQSPELDVKAVITVLQHGDRRADLTYRLLELYNRTDVPIGVGAEKPLLAKSNNEEVVQTRALAANYRIPAKLRRQGIQLFIDTCLNSKEKVTVLAYGPATNVALALRAEPRIVDRIERIVLMNGVFFRAGLEYNTLRDPEASQIVYSSGVPVVTVGLDVTMQCRLTPDQLKQMSDSKFENVLFLRKLIGYWQEGDEKKMPTLHDPLAILVTFAPELCTWATGNVTVETHGQPDVSYGLTHFRNDPKGKTKVAREVKASNVVDLFMSRIAVAPRSAKR